MKEIAEEGFDSFRNMWLQVKRLANKLVIVLCLTMFCFVWIWQKCCRYGGRISLKSEFKLFIILV